MDAGLALFAAWLRAQPRVMRARRVPRPLSEDDRAELESAEWAAARMMWDPIRHIYVPARKR